MTQSGGKALRIEEGDVDGFLGWGHVPTLIAQDRVIPEQFTRAQYVCDFELFDDGVMVAHKERAFSTEKAARAWFRFVAWCLAHLTPSDIEKLPPSLSWRLT